MSSDPFNFGQGGAGASTAGAEPQGRDVKPAGVRHALGLPAGSIRAVLAFVVLGLIWTLMTLQREVPIYLQYLMFLILGHYFAAHHKTIKPIEQQDRSPLFLPRGAIRVLIFLGFLAVLGAIFYQNRGHASDMVSDLKMQTDRTRSMYMPLLLIAGFLFGLVIARIGWMLGGKERQPGWYQDIQAWLALLAALGLAVAVIVHLVINPSREASGGTAIKMPQLEYLLAPVVGFYFGARS
jgi:hypothetical protein